MNSAFVFPRHRPETLFQMFGSALYEQEHARQALFYRSRFFGIYRFHNKTL